MFDNIGGKIKMLAKISCWIGIVACVISGVAVMINQDVLVGLLIAAAGSLISWLSSLVLYGFGELIEDTAITAELMVKADVERHGRQ